MAKIAIKYIQKACQSVYKATPNVTVPDVFSY